MNDLERFKAVVHFETPDYVPVFGLPGAPGMAGGCLANTHHRLIETGMPPHVGGVWRLSEGIADVESWHRYWGATGPIMCDLALQRDVHGFRETRRTENGCEIIECESGAVIRQVVDNDVAYSMPEYAAYPVRDRTSWEFWRRRMTPGGIMPSDEMIARCRAYESRTRPLVVSVGGTYSFIRGLMGTERASLALYDEPELIAEMQDWNLRHVREYAFPLIERLRPEIVEIGEDLCYNHGMLLSPAHFHEFCGPFYREVCDLTHACDVDLVLMDSDGNVMDFVGIAESYGVNGLFPFEVKAGNDLVALRDAHPTFVFFGWLEKEVVNQGNEHLIEEEVRVKVPPLLEKSGYFPNGDHLIQPLATFPNLCQFMTVLHEVTGNPEGEFPRSRVTPRTFLC